ncbi:anthrone oxygenase family protein [Lacimicrobium sp. SS2-24]|uniref:anthrone oxygenase family protein n=1 Tax=Lacimicrobium sp. SS2-24 TaxID=2005569 RepID=UPI000B4C1DF8|nr:anthrone oxygenase family protein [Lacimicrobium sp. SS2-24]
MNTLTVLIQIAEPILKLSMLTMLGLYFAFSNTIMTSLKGMSNGAEVMVQINKVILNPLFITCFVLSGISSLYFAIFGTDMMRVSGVLFFIGTTLITVGKNVPLNNALRDSTHEVSRKHVWDEYLDKWVFWNHVRTVSAGASAILMVI